ncbi:MAG: hypothetical protein ACLGHQ_06485 [Acidimicrobiia bacterium]
MSTLTQRLARAVRGRRFGRSDQGSDEMRSRLDRQDALLREAVADLSERLAAIERRLAALEARDQ